MTKETITDWAGARSDKWRQQMGGLEATLAPIDEPLIQALELTAPCRIADIGCGGGATTIEVFRRAPAGSAVHGYDISPTLIDAARRRADERGLAISFAVADMATAAPAGDRYDRLVSRLGVMFFSEPLAACTNLRRWLAPGGRFAFAVWGPVADNQWMAVTREAVASAIDLAPIDLSLPGPFRYGDVTSFLADLEGAGFVDVTATDWRGQLPFGGRLVAADAAQFALASFSSFSELLAERGDNAFDRALQALTARLVHSERDGAVLMNARVHIVTGRAGE